MRPPRADIAVASIEPGDYAFVYDLRLDLCARARRRTSSHFNASWRPAKDVARYPARRHRDPAARLSAEPELRDTLGGAAGAGRLSLRGARSARPRRVDRRAHFLRRVRGARCLGGARRSRPARLGCVARGPARHFVRRLGGAAHRGTRCARQDGGGLRAIRVGRTRRAGTDARGIHRGGGAGSPTGSSPRLTLKEAKIAGFDWADADIPPRWRERARRCCSSTARRTSWLSPDHSRDAVQVRAARAASSSWCRTTTMCHFRCRSRRSNRR